MSKVVSGLVCLLLLSSTAVVAEEPVDLDMVTKIRDEGLRRSQVMDTLAYLTDTIGPRLTGSPDMKRANDWTMEQMTAWGLQNAHLEPFEFGRGWSLSRSTVHMLTPDAVPLIALPKAWSPGTKKAVRGSAMRVKIDDEEDFEKYKGELKGKVLFIDDPGEFDPPGEVFRRYSDSQLESLEEFPIREPRERNIKRARKRWELGKKTRAFFREEKALAVVEPSSRDGGLVRVGGTGAYTAEIEAGVTALVMAAEQYNWILRLLDDDQPVELEIEVKSEFHDDDPMSYNTIAEIPGNGSDEVVMVGAHLDSWHPGTGATDNAAGCAVAMEAVRILTAIGVEPRRTIRVALWSGEEQGLFGSRAYVKEHFATRPEPEEEADKQLPRWLREEQWPLELLPEHDRLSAYFNLDNGSGKIRGIYAEENAAIRPIFEAWLEPLEDLGADTVTLRRTGGTDHLSFDRVGLPGFQFIQDGLDYSTRTHHTNMDVYDHLQANDMKQASVVMATFLYHAAMREERLPRKPVPQKPPEKDDEKDEDDGDDD